MKGPLVAFWGASAVLAYSYAGFPGLVLARAALRPRPWVDAGSGDGTGGPPDPERVTVVIAAHNEAASIGAKVENILGLDYPADALDCVVVSDGSTDDTVREANRTGDPRIVVLDLPRSGKAGALNRGVDEARGDVLVFTDANSMLSAEAVTELVRPFADQTVGGVAGDQRYVGSDGSASGERAYWDFDRVLKVAESRSGNVISATGALYAVRRSLARPVPEGVTDDFAISTGVIEQGHRLVFAEGAIAYEPPAADVAGEYARKVRVMTRGLRGVLLRRALLDPRRSGFYAVQLLSHKVLRRLSVLPLLISATSAVLLRRRSPVYRLAALAEVGIIGTACAGLVLTRTGLRDRRWVALPAYFAMVNAAALHALWNVVTGKEIKRWTPQRGPVDG